MTPRYLSTLLLLLSVLSGAQALAADEALEKELRIAASIGDTETVERLLDQGASADAANNFGKTALMMAIEGDNLETVALLLARGASVNARTVAGCSAIKLKKKEKHVSKNI